MKKVIVGDNGVITSNGKAHYIDVLPDDFTELQYISTTGKSALDTGIVVQETDTIIVTYELTNLTQTGDKFIVTTKRGLSSGIWVETYGNKNTWYVRFGSSSSVNTGTTTGEQTGVHTFEVRKNYFGVDGAKRLTPSYSAMPDSTLYVGGRITNGAVTSGQGYFGRLYEVKIVDENGGLRWWGKPVKNSNNVAGLYDLVKDNFHSSDTPVSFTAGLVKESA